MRSSLFVVIAAILFGTTGTAQAFVAGGASASSVGAARMVVGGSLMALVGLVARRRRLRTAALVRAAGKAEAALAGAAAPSEDGGRRSLRRYIGVRFPIPTWLALVGAAAGMMAYQVTFFAGTRANGVAVGTLVTLGTSPLWAGLFEWLLRSHPPGRSWLGATGLAVFGVTLLTGANGTADPSGLLLSVAAGAAYGLELVLIKVPLDRGWNASDAVSWVMGLAAVMAVPVLLTTDLGWIQHGRGVAVVAWLAVVTIVISYQLVAAGLKRLSAATVTTLTMAEPATATLLGLILLNESLSVTGVLGLTAIIGGLVVLTASAPVSTEG